MVYCGLHRTLNVDFPPPEKNCIQVYVQVIALHAVFLRRRKVRVQSSMQTTVPHTPTYGSKRSSESESTGLFFFLNTRGKRKVLKSQPQKRVCVMKRKRLDASSSWRRKSSANGVAAIGRNARRRLISFDVTLDEEHFRRRKEERKSTLPQIVPCWTVF